MATTTEPKPAEAKADTTAKREERAARKVPTRTAGQAMTITRDQILIRKEFNPRSEMEAGALAELAASIEQRGVLQAITVRPDTKAKGKYLLLGGHRRVAAGDRVGVTHYPAVVRDSDERDELVDAFVDNKLREDLNPLEEALTFQRLRDGGLTVKGISESCTVSEKLVHDRLVMLELPKEIQAHYATGVLSTGTVRPLATMAKINPKLALEVVKQALGDASYQVTVAAIMREPGGVAVQVAGKVKGLIVTDWQGHLSVGELPWKSYKGGDTLTVADDMERMLAQLAKGTESWNPYRVTLDKSAQDTLRAAGVLHFGGDRAGAIITDPQSLMAVVEPLVRKDHAALLKRQQEHRSATNKGGDAAAKADEAAKAYKQTVDAHAANLQLGDTLVTNLASVTLTMDVAKALCFSILEGNVYGQSDSVARGLAMRGMRYVLSNWQEVKQQANGKIKVKYPSVNSGGGPELERLFWEWWNLATTPGEVVGRTLIALAAATYANQDAVPQSQRSWHDAFGTGNSQAKDALKRIVEPHLPKKQAAKRAPKTKPAAAASATATEGEPAAIPGQTTVEEQINAAAPATRQETIDTANGVSEGTRREQALRIIGHQPGITIPELAAAMGIQQNYLYRLLPALAEEHLVLKSGRGWHILNPEGIAKPAAAEGPVEVTDLQGKVLKAFESGVVPEKGDLQAAVRKTIGVDSSQAGTVGNAIKQLLAKQLLGGDQGAPYITKRGSEIAATL